MSNVPVTAHSIAARIVEWDEKGRLVDDESWVQNNAPAVARALLSPPLSGEEAMRRMLFNVIAAFDDVDAYDGCEPEARADVEAARAFLALSPPKEANGS